MLSAGELRISAGFAMNQGRLEINYRGEWGTSDVYCVLYNKLVFKNPKSPMNSNSLKKLQFFSRNLIYHEMNIK